MGGVVMINVALMHPRLFATVVTFEPIILSHPRQYISLGAFPVTFRRDQWPSREAALQSFQKHPTYKKWTQEALDLFIKYGLRDLPTLLYPEAPKDALQPVTLTTTKYQEALSFSRRAYPPDRSTPLSKFVPTQAAHPDIGDASWGYPQTPFYRPEVIQTFHQLPYLRPSCLWLWGKDTQLFPDKLKRAEKTAECGIGVGGSGGVAAGRVEERELEGGGHYLPLEAPAKLADDTLGPWLEKEVGRWVAETKEERQASGAVEKAKRSQYDPDWEWWMKTHNDPRKMIKAVKPKI
jgi:pimeloyl-ACP methyl ester carboxylesterase